MNYNFSVTGTENFGKRLRRDSRSDDCERLGYGSITVELISDLAGDIGSLPIIGSVAGVATSVVGFISHLTKGVMDMTENALDCESIPFDEIKEMVDKRFNEHNRKLDQNVEALAKVYTMVSTTSNIVQKMRQETSKGFNMVISTIENNNIKDRVFQIHNFAEYFLSEKDRINSLSKDDYVAKLEEENGILLYLKDSRTPKGDSLYTALHDIIDNNLAITTNANDFKKASQALHALLYGTQTYITIFIFLMEGHSYLANYYYQEGNYEKFNRQFDIIKTIFNDFKYTLLGQRNNGFLSKVKYVLQQANHQSNVISILEDQIIKMNLPVIKDTPPTVVTQFRSPFYNTPLGMWVKGLTVRYAVQYEKNGMYSKLSPWSEPLSIKSNACPYVRTPIDPENRVRLVFRKIGDEKPELVSLLSKTNAEFRDLNRDLYNAAGSANINESFNEATKFIEYGAKVNAIFELGRSVLHNAAKSGNVKLIKLLINNGFSNINIKDKKGYTPLHVAADSGRVIFIRALIKNGADVNAVTSLGYTALHIGARNGYTNVVEELVKKGGINVNAKDKYGFAPLHYSVNGSLRLVLAFYNRKELDLDVKSNVGQTPAHLTAIKGNANIMKALIISKKFDINVVDINNMTPLHFAVMMGHTHIVKLMLGIKGINLNVVANSNNWTPLHYAAFFKRSDIAIELIKNSNIDVNVKTIDNITPLHMAASNGMKEVVNELLQKTMNVDEKTSKGHTALHLAIIKDAMDVVMALTDKGANLTEKLNVNLVALNLAKMYARSEAVNYLQFKGMGRYRKNVEYTTSSKEFAKKVPRKINSASFQLTKSSYETAPKTKTGQTFKNLKWLENENHFNQIKRGSIQKVDGNGILILLDVLVRKFTKEEHMSTDDEDVLDFEAQSKALTITSNFEKLISVLQNFSTEDDEVDFFEVYLRVKKALINGRGSKLINILCSYSKMFSCLKLEYKEKLTRSFFTVKPIIQNFTDENLGDLIALFGKTCVA